MGEDVEQRSGTNRRAVVLGIGGVGVLGAVAACGTSGANSGTTGGSGAASGIKTTDVPVGGGKIVGGVVVTQPTAGTFKAFSSVCPHQGCAVDSVTNNVITCPCHGSTFSATDGSVQGGPAQSGLPAKTATVTNGEITVS